jgi:hypothetical protein
MELDHCLTAAFRLLRRAHEYAAALDCGPWEFAVEIDSFHDVGLTNSDLRWLLLQGYIAHAWDVTQTTHGQRTFQSSGRILGPQSCFILTPAGLPVAGLVGNGPPLRMPSSQQPCRPRWEKDRRILWFGPCLVKQFKVPAANQELILVAFEEENWRARIDDPLPLHGSIDPKRRLHDTINSLNRNQRAASLRFYGDGTGEAVCWEPLGRGSPPVQVDEASSEAVVPP